LAVLTIINQETLTALYIIWSIIELYVVSNIVVGTLSCCRCSSCSCGYGWWTSSSGSVSWRLPEPLLRIIGRLTREKTCRRFL